MAAATVFCSGSHAFTLAAFHHRKKSPAFFLLAPSCFSAGKSFVPAFYFPYGAGKNLPKALSIAKARIGYRLQISKIQIMPFLPFLPFRNYDSNPYPSAPLTALPPGGLCMAAIAQESTSSFPASGQP